MYNSIFALLSVKMRSPSVRNCCVARCHSWNRRCKSPSISFRNWACVNKYLVVWLEEHSPSKCCWEKYSQVNAEDAKKDVKLLSLLMKQNCISLFIKRAPTNKGLQSGGLDRQREDSNPPTSSPNTKILSACSSQKMTLIQLRFGLTASNKSPYFFLGLRLTWSLWTTFHC